jgi:hypothetical protein
VHDAAQLVPNDSSCMSGNNLNLKLLQALQLAAEIV